MEDKKSIKKQVTLEDLLRLKRTEKPDEVFWESFEKELHEKAMQTIICKTSLRSRLLNVLCNFSFEFRQAVPIGAAALLTIGFFIYSQKPVVSNLSEGIQVAVIERGYLMNPELAVDGISSIKRNFVKNSVTPDAHDARCYANRIVSPIIPKSNDVRYLAGSVVSANPATMGSVSVIF